MTTVRQATERLRQDGSLPPAGAIGLLPLMQRFPSNMAGSARALILDIFGTLSQKAPFAVILCRYKGASA